MKTRKKLSQRESEGREVGQAKTWGSLPLGSRRSSTGNVKAILCEAILTKGWEAAAIWGERSGRCGGHTVY
jgi:hypothetical protein